MKGNNQNIGTKTDPNVPLTKEDYNKLKTIIEYIESDKKCYDFLLPVDYVGLGLDDYPQFIKRPMDISTIKNAMNKEVYKTAQDVLDDIQLIWDNCKLYNVEGSVYL